MTLFDAPEPPATCGHGRLVDECPWCELSAEAHARTSDPATSHAAAQSLPPSTLRTSQANVFTVAANITPTGFTLETLVSAYQHSDWPEQSPSGIRTRCKELQDAGLIVDTGRKTRLSSGRMARVLEVR